MSRSIRALFILGFCFAISIPASAQKTKKSPVPPAEPALGAPILTPGVSKKTSGGKDGKSFDDSAEFAKTFKEIYPIIKPKQSVREQALQYYARLSRAYVKLDIDSVEMYKMAMTNLDTNAGEKLIFDVYRKNLSAKELKAYLNFIKTTEGKSVIEVMPQLQRAQSETSGYVSKTINANLAPLRQKQMEMAKKEQPPRDSVKGPDGNMMLRPNPGMDSDRMRMRDSMMKAVKDKIKSGEGK